MVSSGQTAYIHVSDNETYLVHLSDDSGDVGTSCCIVKSSVDPTKMQCNRNKYMGCSRHGGQQLRSALCVISRST